MQIAPSFLTSERHRVARSVRTAPHRLRRGDETRRESSKSSAPPGGAAAEADWRALVGSTTSATLGLACSASSGALESVYSA